jgi:hypothetical protein
MATSVQVTFDCADPDRLARFWVAVLGYHIPRPPEGFATWEEWAVANQIPEDQWNAARAIEDADGPGPRIFFQRVPEPKATKNRVHLDVNVGGGRNTPLGQRVTNVGREVQRVIGLGATEVGPMKQGDEYWVVMQDPEGNEFCLQ